MAAVGLSEHDAQQYINNLASELGPGDLTVACVNNPTNVTVSGNRAHVEALTARLERAGTFARMLKVPVAYHGPHMNLVADEYRTAIGHIYPGQSLARNHVNMISSVTADRVSKDDLRDPGYWVRNMVSQVKFSEAIQVAFASPKRKIIKKLDLSHQQALWATEILEIGPHGTLSGPIRESLKPLPHGDAIEYFSVLSRKKNACITAMEALGHLHCKGYAVNLLEMNESSSGDPDGQICLPSLPSYPFNHKKSFWFESRISKEMRFRKNGKNAFLGSPVPDWNPLDARWRDFLNVQKSKWIPDHNINDRVLFPAAGMLVMAIEAALEISSGTEVSAIEITDAEFHSALEIPSESHDVETQFQIVPRKSSTTKNSSQYDWQLKMFQHEWSEACRGTIRVIHAGTASSEVDSQSEEGRLTQLAAQQFDNISRQCSGTVEGQELYSRLWKRGYHFGPIFKRILTSTHSSSGEATAEVEILDFEGTAQPTVVHPATLDGILQIMLPSATDGGADSEFATALPTRINRIWLSRKGLLRADAESVKVAVNMQRDGLRNTSSDIVALAADRSLRVFVEGIQTTSISDGLESSSMNPLVDRSARLCWDIVHKPDMTLLQPDHLQTYLNQDVPTLANPAQYYKDFDIILYSFIKHTLAELKEDSVANSSSHLEHYYQWMVKKIGDSHINIAQASETIEDALVLTDFRSRVFTQDPRHSEMYNRAGQHLLSILKGETDALGLLFEGDDLSDFYVRILETADFLTPLQRYVGLLAHKNPSMRVLEVGAGTGGATTHFLEALTQPGTVGQSAYFSEYCFTDISPSFFEKGQQKFSDVPRMSWKVLDAEKDVLEQGFETESFDLIVASLVLHATTSPSGALTNLAKLLKPGGKLVAVEITRPDQLRAGFVFGLLPGWWLNSESSHPDRLSPAFTESEWDERLRSNGFSGVDQIFWDSDEDDARLLSVFVSTRVETVQKQVDERLPSAAIVATSDSCNVYAQMCRQKLLDAGLETSETDFAALANRKDLSTTLVVVIDSASKPFFQSFDEEQFLSLRGLLAQKLNILWISTNEEEDASAASKGIVYGFARTLLSENASLRFTIYEASSSSSIKRQGENLEAVIRHCLSASSPGPSPEPEILEADGLLQIPRAVEDVELNQKVSEQGLSTVRRNVRFGEEDLRLTVQTPGLLDSLIFRQCVEPLPPTLDADEVEVHVMAVGVNFKDCLVALGRVPDNTLGTECAGIVKRAGASCSVQAGDRVVVSALDTYRSRVRCNEALVAKIPDHIPFTAAAKLPTNFVTAYHALVEVGRISSGETVLIHAGAGGTGQAAVQIAKVYGAEVFVTVGNPRKRDLLTSTYGIPKDHVFYSRDTSFAQGVKNATGGRGVDLVLNSLAGDELRASWDCIAPYGRFLEIGKRDILAHEQLPMFRFARNVSFSAIDIAAMTKERPGLIKKALQAVVRLLADGTIWVASPLRTFSLLEVEDAFRYLQSGTNAGAVVVEVDQNAIVPVSHEQCYDHHPTLFSLLTHFFLRP